MKKLTKYLLSFCILLSCGYSQLSAHPLKENSFFSCLHSNGSEHFSFTIRRNSEALVIKSASTGTEKAIHELEATEIEEKDDELASSKKYIEDGSYSIPLFFTHIPGYSLPNSKKTLLSGKHFPSDTLSSRYLIFQVFRI
jgi:hypothetical protein